MRLRKLPRRLALEALRRVDPVRYARAIGVKVGRDCKLISTNFGTEPFLITLGDRVEVTHGVQFITHDGGVWVLRDELPDIDVVAPIVVGDHCFLGSHAIILPGVTIGRRSLVAAGAVVTRDVPAESVVGGCPARVISTIAEYRERSVARALNIKRMGAEEKRAWLMEHFGVK